MEEDKAFLQRLIKQKKKIDGKSLLLQKSTKYDVLPYNLMYVLNMEFSFGAENLIQGLLHPLVIRSAIGSVFAFLSARVNFSATSRVEFASIQCFGKSYTFIWLL